MNKRECDPCGAACTGDRVHEVDLRMRSGWTLERVHCCAEAIRKCEEAGFAVIRADGAPTVSSLRAREDEIGSQVAKLMEELAEVQKALESFRKGKP